MRYYIHWFYNTNNLIFSIRTLTKADTFRRWTTSVPTQGPPDRVSTQEQHERRGRSNSESILPFIISSVFQALLQRPNPRDSISDQDTFLSDILISESHSIYPTRVLFGKFWTAWISFCQLKSFEHFPPKKNRSFWGILFNLILKAFFM